MERSPWHLGTPFPSFFHWPPFVLTDLSRHEVDGNPTLTAEFTVNMFSSSGIKVNSVVLVNENYKPYRVRAVFSLLFE